MLTNVVLDSCSSGCWLLETILPTSVPIKEKTVKVTTMGNVSNETLTKVVNNLEIQDINRNSKFIIPGAYTKDSKSWPFTEYDIPTMNDVKNYTHLSEVPFNFIEKPITLLIGLNMPGILCPTKVVEGGSNEPFATLHTLGWAVNGPVKGNSSKLLCNRIKINTDIDSKIEQYFTREFLVDSTEKAPSQEDKKWLNIMENDMEKINQHYEVKLPLKNDELNLPDNYSQAYKRFKTTENKLIKILIILMNIICSCK